MKRDVELAKKLLESKGYNVSKRMNESSDPSSQVYDVLNDLGISFLDISEEDGVVYVTGDKPYSPQELNKVWYELTNAESSGFEGQNTMWFAFSDEE